MSRSCAAGSSSCAACCGKSRGIEELCLTTNGVLLPALAAPLRAAGVDRLNISLDTLRPDRFRDITRVGSLADVLRGLEAAESAGFRNLKLNCVLLGGVSDDEIADFAALTLTHPWQVRFIELMPMGTCVGWDRAHFLPSDAVLARCPQLREVGTQGVCRVYRLPGARGTVGLISPMSHRFCSGCDRIRVTADGRLKPCLHSSEEIPLAGLSGAELRRAVERRASPPSRSATTSRRRGARAPDAACMKLEDNAMELTHFNEQGRARMVDVVRKARDIPHGARLRDRPHGERGTMELIRAGQVEARATCSRWRRSRGSWPRRRTRS